MMRERVVERIWRVDRVDRYTVDVLFGLWLCFGFVSAARVLGVVDGFRDWRRNFRLFIPEVE
jgi:hypothetical protein